MLGRVGLAAFLRRKAFVKAAIYGLFIAQEPVFHRLIVDTVVGLLRFHEVEGMGDELGGVAEAALLKLALDALFDGGIEGERHGESITLGRARMLRLKGSGGFGEICSAGVLRLRLAIRRRDSAQNDKQIGEP